MFYSGVVEGLLVLGKAGGVGEGVGVVGLIRTAGNTGITRFWERKRVCMDGWMDVGVNNESAR